MDELLTLDTPRGCSRGEQHLEMLFYAYQMFDGGVSYYSYRGTMMSHFTEAILDLGNHVKQTSSDNTSLKKRASFLMVECFQNILRHGIQEESGEAEGFFGFFSSIDFLTINTINGINPSSVDPLKDALDKVNALSPEEKKQRYREIIQNESFGEEGGAGLGLIEISRKSGSKLDYEMEPKTAGKFSFHQQVTIHYTEQPIIPPQIQFTKMVEHWMEDNGIYMIYRGKLDHQSLQPIIDIMSGMAKTGHWENLGRLMDTLKEIQQSLFDTDAQSGIILVGQNEGNKFIQVGIEVLPQEKVALCELARMQFKAQQWKSKDAHRPFAACVSKSLGENKELFSFQLVP
jgi:hypothetical protein